MVWSVRMGKKKIGGGKKRGMLWRPHFESAVGRLRARSTKLLARTRHRAVRRLPVPLPRGGIVKRDVHEAQVPAARRKGGGDGRAVAAEHGKEAVRPVAVRRHVHHLAALRRARAVVGRGRRVAQGAAAHVVVHEARQHEAVAVCLRLVLAQREAAEHVAAVAGEGAEAADGARQRGKGAVPFVEYRRPRAVGRRVVQLQAPQRQAARRGVARQRRDLATEALVERLLRGVVPQRGMVQDRYAARFWYDAEVGGGWCP